MTDDNNLLLMSDELRGNVPELEGTEVAAFREGFVLVEMDMTTDVVLFGAHRPNTLVGNLVGVELNIRDNVDKIDLRVPIPDAYALLSHVGLGGVVLCTAYRLVLGDDTTRFVGPFDVKTPKMFDFDPVAKMCVLALDLDRRRVKT